MADAWALQKLAQYQDGKILLWSWLSRGLVTIEQVAAWRFNGSEKEVESLLESTPNEMKALCDLDEMPDLEDEAQKQQVVLAQEAALAGEVASAWAIKDTDNPLAEPIMLPDWFSQPIDKSILIWKQEAAIWQSRLQKRLDAGFDDLAPKMKKNFQEWEVAKTRQIVLNKITKTQVTKLAGKTARQLKKSCLMLEIHMSDDPEELGITAGAGKLWRLCLLQGTLPTTDAVPKEVDHFAGDLLTCVLT